MHKSVLLNESINNLNILENGKYIDATLGYAGHSSKILEKLKDGFLYSFDQDIEAVKFSDNKLSSISKNYKIINDNFVNIKKYIKVPIDGILFDLGVSSPQLDNSERGFSFHNDALLDMRMDKNNLLTAKYIVNNYSFEKLRDIFFKFGEEKYSNSIANKICKYREKKEIESTLELVDIIKDSVPFKYKNNTHPARKVFQSLRIEVNHELDILESSLLDAFDLLNKGGRLCVITFHSLEDRIVKNVFKKLTEVNNFSNNLPIIPDNMKPKAKSITKKPIIATENELEINNRSRSAKLRVIEKI